MSIKEEIEVLEEIMDLDENTLEEDSVLNEIEEWDSLSKLSLMAYMRKKHGLLLKPETIKSFYTVKDIYDFILENSNGEKQ